ncbi:MAG: spondin domain-containing protein [Solirubrobacterales bacterium]
MAAAMAATLALAAPAFGRSYEVTITNLTGGQPLTPPVAATHRGKHAIFDVGRPAGFGVKEIAENGNNAPLLTQLGAARKVAAFTEAGTGPLVPPGRPGSAMFGDRVKFTIEAGRRANRLSFVTMLICTNDGFTGVDGVKLPTGKKAKVSKATRAYDAGTEINTEDYADIVPPCQPLIGHDAGENDPGTGASNPALAEGGVIAHHGGILGIDDLVPSIHGWTDPVAKIRIERKG